MLIFKVVLEQTPVKCTSEVDWVIVTTLPPNVFFIDSRVFNAASVKELSIPEKRIDLNYKLSHLY
jgi:hypothetical protein